VSVRLSTRRRLSAEERRETLERAASEVFAERGYHGAAMDDIAGRAGVSVPIVYDHFASKQELHRALLERHYADLREVWRTHLAGDEPLAERVERGVDAWFAYMEAHPYAPRMLFRDTTGVPAIEAMHAQVIADSRTQILYVLTREFAGSDRELLMAWEIFRAALQGLALWWREHPEVTRAEVVAVALRVTWAGFASWPAHE
jgi:AcrR family transcriptional regulator